MAVGRGASCTSAVISVSSPSTPLARTSTLPAARRRVGPATRLAGLARACDCNGVRAARTGVAWRLHRPGSTVPREPRATLDSMSIKCEGTTANCRGAMVGTASQNMCSRRIALASSSPGVHSLRRFRREPVGGHHRRRLSPSERTATGVRRNRVPVAARSPHRVLATAGDADSAEQGELALQEATVRSAEAEAPAAGESDELWTVPWDGTCVLTLPALDMTQPPPPGVSATHPGVGAALPRTTTIVTAKFLVLGLFFGVLGER